MKHSPYIHAHASGHLKYSKDFQAYILRGVSGHIPSSFPSSIYRGERFIYLTPGIDTLVGGGWRGNLSDDWPCIDFGFDFIRALEWLHHAEESIQTTTHLWEKE